VSLHRLTHLIIGVPNLDEAAKFYTDFGLTPVQGHGVAGERRFGTVDGGEQLILVHTPIRRLVEIGVAAEDRDDLHIIQSRLARLDIESSLDGAELAAVEPATGIAVKIAVAEQLQQKWQVAEQNYPADIRRPDVRAPALYREARVRPRKLGHVVFEPTTRHLNDSSWKAWVSGSATRFKTSERSCDAHPITTTFWCRRHP
jgi:catechol 2,3-dioxygenase-like lactoylglutathione lyase family enzyme